MKLKNNLKNIGFYVLKISITAGLLIFLFHKTDVNKMISIVKEINIFYFTIALALFVFSYFLGILRWQVLLRGTGVVVPFPRVTVSYLMGLAINLFVPSTVGGDLARGVDLSVYSSSSKPKILATVLIDRLSGYVAVVVIAFFSIVFGYKFVNDKAVLVSFGILVLILLVIILLSFSKIALGIMLAIFNKIKTIENALIRFNEAISVFRSRSRLKTVANSLLLAFVIQVGSVLIIYFIARSLKIDIGMIYFFIFVPIISAISMIPVTIGGLGLRDSSSIFFFARVGLSASAAFTLSLMSFFLVMLAGIIGGIVYVFTLYPRRIHVSVSPRR